MAAGGPEHGHICRECSLCTGHTMYIWYIVHMGCTVHIGCMVHIECHVLKMYLWHTGSTIHAGPDVYIWHAVHKDSLQYIGCQCCKCISHCLFTLSNGEPNHASTFWPLLALMPEGAAAPCRDFPGFTAESSQATILLILDPGSELPCPCPHLSNAEVR